MIKAVLFDLDGTLIDTEKYYRVCWKQTMEMMGFHMTDEQALKLRSLGRPFGEQTLRKWFGETFDYEAVRKNRNILLEEMLQKNGVEIKKGAIELLAYLKKQKITAAVVTATDLKRAGEYLNRVNLAACFDRIISAREVERGKPAPDVYRYACEELGLAPEECFVIEDSPNGVKSGYGAGCKVIMVPDQTPPEPELERMLYARATNLQEICQLVEQENAEITEKL